MKNILTVFFSIITFCSLIAQENQFEYNNAVKLNPARFGASEFQISYERYFNDRKSSITVAPSFILEDNNDKSKEGWQVMAQYRFYLTHFNKERESTFLGMDNYGFYTGVYGLYLNYSSNYLRWSYNQESEMIREEYHKDVSAQEGGAVIGVQIDITKRILVDFYVGGGVRYTTIDDTFNSNEHPNEWYDTYNVFDPEYKGVKPTIGLLVGFLF